jgi:hypothetical protein
MTNSSVFNFGTPEGQKLGYLYLQVAVVPEGEPIDWERVNCSNEEFRQIVGRYKMKQAGVEVLPINPSIEANLAAEA